MAWNEPLTVVSGELMMPDFWNAQVRDLLSALRTGAVAMSAQAAGDLVEASSATQWRRVAAVTSGVPYFTGGAWTVRNLFDLVYPVGSLFYAVVSTNPATLLGFGTWATFGAGRMVIGVNAADSDFNAAEKTGGAKTHTLTTAELPVHSHGVTDPTHRHQHGYKLEGSGSEFSTDQVAAYPGSQQRTLQTKTTGITLGNTGGGGSHDNLQPYVVVYMWKRTA